MTIPSDSQSEGEIEIEYESPDNPMNLDESLEEDRIMPIAEMQIHTDEVCTVQWHPIHPNTFASGSVDEKSYLVRFEEIHELPGNTETITRLKFSGDGEYLAVACMDGSITVWSSSNFQSPLCKLEGPSDEVMWIDWHPRGPVIAASSSDMSIWVWDVRQNSTLAVFTNHRGPVHMAKFSKNGRFLYSCSDDSTARVWDLKDMGNMTAPNVAVFTGHGFHEAEVLCAVMRDDNNTIITGSSDGTICTSIRNHNRVVNKISAFQNAVEAIELCTIQPWFAAGSMSGDVKVYEIDNLSLRFSLELRGGVTKMICYENDIYVAGTDGLLSCIDVRTGEVLREYGGNTSTILDLDVSRYPDQPTRLLIGTEDQKIYIYDAIPPSQPEAQESSEPTQEEENIE
jgi:WD40 repeat protein